MKKEVLLVLGILEGRDWRPVDGHRTIIEAQLDNHKLSTDAFPLTNAPKFNTEVTWEAEKQTIRSYKLNRVPIKIECFSLSEQSSRKSLGYIVLPLTSAVEGVEVDSKWHKLLGAPNTNYKTPPSIRLRLHLEPLALDKQNQINTKQMTAFRNGEHTIEDTKMAYLLEKNKFMHEREQVEVIRAPTQTNGNSRGGNRHDNTAKLKHMMATNGVSVLNADELGSDDHMDDDDEDMLDYDSEEEYEEGDHNSSGIIVDSYSLAEQNESEEMEHSAGSRFAGQNVDRRDNRCQETGGSKENSSASQRGKGNDSALPDDSSAAAGGSTNNRKCVDKQSSDHESLLKSRASAREHLLNLSQSLRLSKFPKEGQIPSPLPTAKSSSEHLSFEKRLLDTSNLLDGSYEQKNKSRRLDLPPCDTSFSDQIRDTQKKEKEKSDSNFDLLRSKLAQNHSTTSTAFLLSQTIGESSKAKPRVVKALSQHKLVPHLNKEEGYFTIGPRDGELDEEFNFSITIVYAKHLSKIIPKEVIPSLKGGFRFCYSLLGHSIYTDPFTNLSNPEFLAEKASAVIRSSHQSLSKYFTQHYFLAVHFLSGETCLGVCTIDILQLVEIANKSESTVEGVYEVNPVDDQVPLNSPDSKAMLAVSIEVTKSTKGSHFPRDVNSSYNEVVVSDSMSSGSDCEEESFARRRRLKTGTKRFCYSCRSHFSEQEDFQQMQDTTIRREVERQKKALLHEAAYEVERWKEEQQKYYLKEWAEKEDTLHKMIASEWSSKVKIMEGELGHRLSECDKLQEKLSSALSELSIREDKFKVRENKLILREQELNLEKEKLEVVKLKGSQMEKQSATAASSNLANQLEAEKKKRSHLEKEMSKLEEELVNSEENLKAQTQEIINLRRKLVESDDIIGVSKQMQSLVTKIESLQERKQYYKTQWLSAITDLHKLHSAHKNTIEEITSDLDRHREMPGRPGESRSPTTSPDTAGFKLRKLKDERKLLLESGFYSYNHSIIKNIERKIKELVG